MQREWFENFDNVLGLAHWMADQGEFDDFDAILYYFGNPWKYEQEWMEYLECHCGKHERQKVKVEL